MRALVLRTFRKDVFQSLQAEIRPEHREEALLGTLPLCAKTLYSILLPNSGYDDSGEEPFVELCLARAKQRKIRTVKQFVDLLWDFDDGRRRTKWEHRSWRTLYRRACFIVGRHCGKGLLGPFQTSMKREFVLTNWIVPYANEEKFLQKDDQKRRLWLSIYHKRYAFEKNANSQLRWGRMLQVGQDASIPKLTAVANFMPGWHLVGWSATYKRQEGRDMPCLPAEPPEAETLNGGIDIAGFHTELREYWDEARSPRQELLRLARLGNREHERPV
jgi:hypothetical protein